MNKKSPSSHAGERSPRSARQNAGAPGSSASGRRPSGASGRSERKPSGAAAAPVDTDAIRFPPPPLAPDSLAFALDGAAQVIGAVRAGAALPAALASIIATQAAPLARGATQDIAYRTLRALGLADALATTLVAKAPPPHVANLLTCALALLADAPENAAYAPFTVVDQAVSAIGARRELNFAKGLVNAVLRNFLRQRETLLAEAMRDPVARWNAPHWWINAVRKAWPEQWQAVLDADRVQGPLTLRVNRRKSTMEAYQARLEQAHLPCVAVGPSAVQLLQAVPVDRLPGFADGVVSVQDAGAQRAAVLLDVRDGMRVLDACAAPGGKSGHLLELADIELVALESDAVRSRRIDENLARLGLQAQVQIGDAGDPSAWWDGKPFDRILADVPCSASGIVRRHPDIRWLRRATDIAPLVALQRRIVLALWPLLAKDGELLYVTCSIFPEEGELQAQWFESVQQDAVRLDAPGQLLPSAAVPGTQRDANHDGFFYARFQKR